MTKNSIEDLVAIMIKNKYCIDVLLLTLKLKIARGIDLINFLVQSYQLHRSSGYRNLTLLVKIGMLEISAYSGKCLFYRVPLQIKSFLLKFLRFQGKVRIEETPTTLIRVYQGQFVIYKTSTLRIKRNEPPKILLEPNL